MESIPSWGPNSSFFGAFRPPGALLVVAIGLSEQNGVERIPWELWGPILDSFWGGAAQASNA
eukprot:13830718-Alexandrium_andersonii.AAC.1